MPSLPVGYLPVGAMLAGYLLTGTMLTNTAFMGKRLLCSPCICIDSPYMIIIGGSSAAITPTHERFVGAAGAHEIATTSGRGSDDAVGNSLEVRWELAEGIGSLLGWRKGVHRKKTETRRKIIGSIRKAFRELERS
ncbi:hypothetical protein B296_00046514 [Ensete ventricosum]|uniref:Uncharacterized protein n=1 Tax=Ensete ventricosum TaxID=4639 RepID=A0A426YC48_ENSVE|nr:hypothetical protein B296_00046514 [Ensete ventricosum]